MSVSQLPADVAEKIETIKVLPLQPGDRLAISVNDDYKADYLHRMQHVISEWAGVPVAILSPGMSLEIVRQDEPCPTS